MIVSNNDINSGAWVLDAFQRGGVDLEQLAVALPRELEVLARAPHTQKPDDMSRLFVECAEQSGDPHFGLHMVDFAPINSLGIYGYLLLNAPTIGELLNIAEKYFSTFFLGAQLKLSRRGAICKLHFQRAGPETVSPCHGNEWALGFFTHLLRSRISPDWYPDRVKFSNKSPDDLTELSRVLGPKLLFGQKETSIEFDQSFLSQTISDVDTRLLRIMIAYADELLSKVGAIQSLESRVRLLILESLNSGNDSAKHVASALNMSLSTLKRHLKDNNLSYRLLREEIIMNLAKSALAETDTSISNIAINLGYSGLCAFDRAFFRVNEQTPLAYRKSSKQKVR